MNEKNEYDVCIAGSGPAGAFAANLLAKNGYKVIIIEAGGDFLNSNVDEIVDLENSNLTNSINFGLSRQIGGSSNLWGGALVGMDDIDLESRSEYDFLNWPVKKNELSMLYQRVAKIIGIESSLDKEFDSDTNYTKDLIYSTNIKFKEMHFMQHPFNTKVLINNVKNITIKKCHEVCTLKICNENKSISSIRAFNSINSSFVDIKAKKFILATGTIDNVRILLHSLQSLSSTNHNLLNSIGTGFSTHPKGVVGKIKFNKGITNKSPFLMVKSSPSGFIRFFFGFSEKYLKKNNLLNHSLRVDSVHALKILRYLEYCKRIFTWLPFLKNNHSLMKLLISFGAQIFKLSEKIKPSPDLNETFIVRGFFDQPSKLSNKISLSSKKSKSGLPLAKIDWDYDNKDWENIDRFMQHLKEELTQKKIGYFDYSRPIHKDFIGIHSHFLGGTRSGVSSKNSVVDRNLKVHGFTNLFISGPSVFPSFGYANPFFSIAALSIRLADHLNAKLKKN